MTWGEFLKMKINQRDMSNKHVYIAIFIAFFIGWVLG